MRPIVPVANLQRRLPTAGRIRTGIRGPKGAPKAINTFRFTSSDEEAIRQIAAVYGGEAKPWSGAPTPDQWEVITTASEIKVVLPPDPLGGSPIYEMWSGGGCQRRCDGVTCSVMQTGPDGGEMVDTDCICTAKGCMECSPHTRLSVILPEVRFAGVWRYESGKSWAVAQEMPGMVDLIQSLQDRGLTRGLLAIEARKTVTAGQTHRFTIPVLRVADTFDQVLAGAARVGSIVSPDQPVAQIGTGQEVEEDIGAVATDPGLGRPSSPDHEPVEAEVMADQADVGSLDARLACLPTNLRNRAERLRHHAGLPSLGDGLSVRDLGGWHKILNDIEASQASAKPDQTRQGRADQVATEAGVDPRAVLLAEIADLAKRTLDGDVKASNAVVSWATGGCWTKPSDCDEAELKAIYRCLQEIESGERELWQDDAGHLVVGEPSGARA